MVSGIYIVTNKVNGRRYSDPIWIVRKDSFGILSHKAPQSHN
jgi:hypothetical protein